MEVASPLMFAPTGGAGSKRSLACSPQLLVDGYQHSQHNHNNDDDDDDNDLDNDCMPRSAKRRRYHTDTSIESLSEHFSSHSPFFTNTKQPPAQPKGIFASPSAISSLRRARAEPPPPPPPCPVQEDLKRVVEEQTLVIESLKSDKQKLEASMVTLRSDHERVLKENHILRKAVSIQQERQTQAETANKTAQQYRNESDEKIRKLEHLILTLRYHLQAQSMNHSNDFLHMSPRPPDVF